MADGEHSRLPTGVGANAALALLLCVVFFGVGLTGNGICDPFELERAELARRIAVQLFGAQQLAVEGALNTMPTLSDLGGGELGFTSMAWGLSTFGLHDWAGRLPLALWALTGVMALFFFMARQVSPRAGLYASVVLVTMPAYFVQARTMLGDVVSMAAFCMAFFGMLGAMMESRSRSVAAAWLALGILGALAGYLARGAAIGVAAPLAGVGLSWLVLRGASSSWFSDGCDSVAIWPGRWSSVVGGGCLVAGAVATAAAVQPLWQQGWEQSQVLRVLGIAVAPAAPVESTFDLTLRDLGHALFPWSAFVPFAVGRMFWLPAGGDEARRREIAVRVALLVGLGCAYAAHALLAPYSGTMAFCGPALVAAVAAVAIADFGRGAPPSGVVGVGTVLVALVLLRDFDKLPVKALSVFGLAEGNLPSHFEPQSDAVHMVASSVFLLGCLLTWIDPPALLAGDREVQGAEANDALMGWLRRRIEQYEHAFAQLTEVWKGNLVFGFFVFESALVGFGAMILVGGKLDWASVESMPLALVKLGLNLWWALPLALLLAPISLDLARAGFAFAAARARVPRAAGFVVAALVAGALMSFAHFPALAGQLSPKASFDAYVEHHGPGEPLGVMGLSARAGRYYSEGEQIRALPSAHAALRWLDAGRLQGQRRWLVFRHQDLAELNALHRQMGEGNLPIIDAARGEILLASNDLAGVANANPLEPFVLSEAPARIQRPLMAHFGSSLEALGWEVMDERGAIVDFVVPGRAYQVRLYFRVHAALKRNYRAFLHIDGYKRRHNGDHDVLGGAYGMLRWRPGDVVVDVYDLVLEPNFTPGDYTLYFGFFSGKDRLAVSRGKHHENRVVGGVLTVR